MRIPIKGNFKLHNTFEFTVTDAETGEVVKSARAENIVLNNYLEHVLSKSGSPLIRIALGSGTGDLSPDRTSLFKQELAKEAAEVEYVNEKEYAYVKKSIVLGVEEGNNIDFTEVGFHGAWGLVTHAFIKDSQGNNIAISKTSSQVLTVLATVYVELGQIDSELAGSVHWIPCSENGWVSFILGRSSASAPKNVYAFSALMFPENSLQYLRDGHSPKNVTWQPDLGTYTGTFEAFFDVGNANMPIGAFSVGDCFVVTLPVPGIWEGYQINDEPARQSLVDPRVYTLKWDIKPGTEVIVKKNGEVVPPSAYHVGRNFRIGKNLMDGVVVYANTKAGDRALGTYGGKLGVLTVYEDGSVTHKPLTITPAAGHAALTIANWEVAVDPEGEILCTKEGVFDIDMATGEIGQKWTMPEGWDDSRHSTGALFTRDGRYLIRMTSAGVNSYGLNRVNKSLTEPISIAGGGGGSSSYSYLRQSDDGKALLHTYRYYSLESHIMRFDETTGEILADYYLGGVGAEYKDGLLIRGTGAEGFIRINEFDIETMTIGEAYSPAEGTVPFNETLGFAHFHPEDDCILAGSPARLIRFNREARTYEIVPYKGLRPDEQMNNPIFEHLGESSLIATFHDRIMFSGDGTSTYCDFFAPGTCGYDIKFAEPPAPTDIIEVSYTTDRIPKSDLSTVTLKATIGLGGS